MKNIAIFFGSANGASDNYAEQWTWAQLKLSHLKTLQALREYGSLVTTSKHLHVTLSALSHQLKELENYLDLKLISRKSRPLQFSPAGLKLLELADQVIPLINTICADLTRMAHG